MPTISESQQSFQSKVKTGELQPVEKAPQTEPGAPAIPAFPQEPNSFLRTPMPASTVLQPDTLRQFFSAANPQTRVPPVAPNANPNVGASAASQSITVVQQGKGTILKTNGILNNLQSELNLIAGTGITLTAGAQGQVVIDSGAAGGSTGVALGDPLNLPQIDPASVIFVDDFTENAPSTAVSGTEGGLGWFVTAGTGTSILSMSHVLPNAGVVRFQTGTSNNAAARMFLSGPPVPTANYGRYQPFNVDKPGWKLTWIFRITQATSAVTPNTGVLVFYIGMAASSASALVTDGRQASGVWLRFDTNKSDTTYQFEAVANNLNGTTTDGTIVDSGVAPDFAWHRLQIRSIDPGKVLFKLDNGTEQEITLPTISSNDWSALSRTSNLVTLTAFNSPLPIAGQAITITGSNPSSFNGTFTVLQIDNTGTSTPPVYWLQTDSNASALDAFLHYTPPMTPFVMWGNGAAGGINKILDVDFFAYIYNPKLASSWADVASDASKARYYDSAA